MNTTETDRETRGWRRLFTPIRFARLSTTERAIIDAQGKLLAVLVAALQSGIPFDAKHFADMLVLLGTVTSEDDRLQGEILAIWGDTVRESLECIAAAELGRDFS